MVAKRMGYEEFLAWYDEDTLAEWVGWLLSDPPVLDCLRELGVIP